MNRMEEYHAWMAELEQLPPGLEDTLARAYRRKRRRLRPLGKLAAVAAMLVLLAACSRLPVLRDLIAAVTFSDSLTKAVENEFVQPMNLTQTQGDITAEIAYLIVDQKQVNVFYRLDSPRYTELSADPEVREANGERPVSCGWANDGFGRENGELRRLIIDFTRDNVPERLIVKLSVYDNGPDAWVEAAPEQAIFADTPREPSYLAEFEFLLEFDPAFTAAGKHIAVNQPVELDGQRFTVTNMEIYPTHMRLEIAEEMENTAWLKDLDFYIETDGGKIFETVRNGITAMGSEDPDSQSMTSFMAESSYFYDANQMKLVITGAKWLDKDKETVHLDLKTGEIDFLPQGVELVSTQKQAGDWIVTLRCRKREDQPMGQIFSNGYYDSQGNRFEIMQWSHQYEEIGGKRSEETYLEEIPLKDYPEDEAWMTLVWSHYRKAEEPVTVTLK